MNIGELINKFDEGDQTIASFNALFGDLKPLEGEGYVEIGEIHGVGRELTRELLVNGETQLHNFGKVSEEKTIVSRGRKGGMKCNHNYLVKKDGKSSRVSTQKKVAEIVATTQSNISEKLSQQDSCEINGFDIVRKEIK